MISKDFTLGIDAGYQVNKNWAFSFGIWYSCQGAKIDDQFVAPANSPSQPDDWFNLGPSLFRYDDFVCRGGNCNSSQRQAHGNRQDQCEQFFHVGFSFD